MAQNHFYLTKMQIGKLLGIIGVILMLTFLLVAGRNILVNGNKVTSNSIKEVSAAVGNDAQVVELTLKNYNYFPNTLNFKKDKLAKIIVDTNKVKGCFTSILIPDLGIRKLVTAKDNVIEFTPTKTGTFRFSCPMGMGSGKIIVS